MSYLKAIHMRLACLSALLPAIMAAGVSALEAPIPGFDVFVPQWEVAAAPGGETLLLNGTVEEVINQLYEINPDFKEMEWLNQTAKESPALAKRADFLGARVYCDHASNVKNAKREVIFTGIGYLKVVGGHPISGGGPAACGKVSCSYKSSIWWCNEDSKPKELRSFGEIADGATKILDTCRGKRINGRVTHRDNWTVIVKGDHWC